MTKGSGGFGVKIDKGRGIITDVNDSIVESSGPLLVADKVVAVNGMDCNGYDAFKHLSSVPDGDAVTVTVQRAILEDADRETCPVCMESYGSEHTPVISVTCLHAVCRGCATLLGDGPCVICRRRGVVFGEAKTPSE